MPRKFDTYRRETRYDDEPSGFRNGQPVYSRRSDKSDRYANAPGFGKKTDSRNKNKKSDRNDDKNRGYKKPYDRNNADGNPDRRIKKAGFESETGKYADSRRNFKTDADKKPAASKTDNRPYSVPEDELPLLIMGRNAVKEAIKSGRSIDKVLVNKEPDGSLREIIGYARDRGLRIDEVDRAKLDELCIPFGHGGKTGNHQGIVAMIPGVEYCDISDILEYAARRNEKPFIILLDGIEDPHNLGSIIRSAVCAGAHGVIIPKRRAVSVTAAACKASAGAVEYCNVCRVSNLAGAIDRLKDEGIWIAGADMSGKPMTEAPLDGAIALVIGNEGDGLSHLVHEKCDFLVSIPMSGKLDSPNAAVAAAVLMFEKKRHDGFSK